MRRSLLAFLTLGAVCAFAPLAGAKVLRVGSFHGVPGQYKSIQAAVNAAKPGDWILIGPGDYKTKPSSISTPKGYPDFPAGVLITKANLHIRGMNRNTVIVDGTKPGTPRCSSADKAQNFGLTGSGGGARYGGARLATAPSGANGLMVWKAKNVSIENLTACNFLGGSRDAGNEVWWNGGANSSKVGGHSYFGAYLNATSTFLKNQSASGEVSAAQYGIFSSNWSGGTWDNTYASNFNDSGYYIGACQQVCDQTVNHAWGEFNALGYSGSNSGGRMLIENSQFDNNEDGFDTNSQNGDEPSPQNGACPKGVKPPVKGAPTCWVFTHNYLHDNNNPNVPAAGAAAAGPVGTGMTVSGGRNDTIMNNRFANDKAWGVAFVAYPDNGKPCFGGTYNSPLLGTGSCLFDEYGDHLLNNKFSNIGGYGNPTNGDFDQLNLENGHPTDCYSGNTDSSGHLSADAVKLEQTYPTCSGAAVQANINVPFLNEILCDTQVKLSGFGCQPGDHYPRVTKIVMHPLPTKKLKTMPNPCSGVPNDPWCGRKKG
jgi:hypothetical protein